MVFPNGRPRMLALRPSTRAFNRTAVDTLVSPENRDGVFPIHRGLKFVLMTTTNGERPRRWMPVCVRI
jgi:hypothetical protein